GLPLVGAGAGGALMSTSPERPAQPMAMVTGGTGKQRCEQVLDLVTGQPDQLGWWRGGGGGQGGGPQEGGGAQGGGGRGRSVRAATTRKAWASMARVVQRYQERQRRTRWASRPQRPLAV